jgi:hypothetical protein
MVPLERKRTNTTSHDVIVLRHHGCSDDGYGAGSEQ